VSAGALVGQLAGTPVLAPLTGWLRGLTYDAVAVQVGQRIVEVDPSPEPEVFGLGAGPQALARGVAHALGLPVGIDKAFFRFERPLQRTLDCMPMSMRMKLDRCGLKLSLEQWQTIPVRLREVLLETSVDGARQVERMKAVLHSLQVERNWPRLSRVEVDEAGWNAPGEVPRAVVERCVGFGRLPLSVERWGALTPIQRFALLKMARGSGRNWLPALDEFLGGPEPTVKLGT
jgi:hypothetical protein